jgi:hypothetical protein
MEKPLTKITALVAFALTSGTVTADQTTKTTAQLAIEQFTECADSLFKDEFEPAEIDYELSLNNRESAARPTSTRAVDGNHQISHARRLATHPSRGKHGAFPAPETTKPARGGALKPDREARHLQPLHRRHRGHGGHAPDHGAERAQAGAPARPHHGRGAPPSRPAQKPQQHRSHRFGGVANVAAPRAARLGDGIGEWFKQKIEHHEYESIS